MYWEDIASWLLVLLLIGVLVLASISIDNDKRECEANNGVWITHYMGGQCLTKEDIEKLRGDE